MEYGGAAKLVGGLPMSTILSLLFACSIQQAPVEMRFEQVYPDRFDKMMQRSLGPPAAVILIHGDLFEVARLATERRSGEAAENQHDRLLALKAGELHVLGFF